LPTTQEEIIGTEDDTIRTRRGREFTESWLPEDEALQAARRRGGELGAVPIQPGGGAVLRFLASAINARAVVEIGTGAGVSGIYLVRGMAPDGILTSIDLETEHQRVARESFGEAGLAPARTRLITGRALDVLPRLTDGGYDPAGSWRSTTPCGTGGCRTRQRVTRRPSPYGSCSSRSATTSGSPRCCCRRATGSSRQSSAPDLGDVFADHGGHRAASASLGELRHDRRWIASEPVDDETPRWASRGMLRR
jgi:hypothetical protein